MASAKEQISLTEAAERLGVHYMTAYRYVRTGRLEGVKDGNEWKVDPDEVAAFLAAASAEAEAPAGGRRTRRRDYPRRLVERLIHGDEPGAWTLIEAALAGGMEPDEIYVDLLAPALQQLGDRWSRGEITIAQEHQGSAVVLRLVGRLGPRFARRGRKRGTVVVGAPPHDSHGIPTALLSDLLRGHSFEVVDLGADVPADSWGSTAATTSRLVAVGICATTPGNDDNVAAAIASLRVVTSAPVVLGGAGIGSAERALALGATAHSTSFTHALQLIDELAAGRATA